MSPPQNARPALHTRKALPTNSRSAKPPPLASRKSHTNTPSKKSPTTRLGPGLSRSNNKSEAVADPEEDDMTGLPQFCTTCEKQILTPGNSILYCSESCRRKDHNKPLQESIIPDLSPLSPTRRASSYFGDDSDALSLRSPMSIRPPSLAFSDSSDSSFCDSRPSHGRNESEAAYYLSQFRPFDSHHEHDFHGASYDHKRLSSSSSLAPSLSHTPNSVGSMSGSYRPLPRRGDPFSASFSSFSVDLITPVINVETATLPNSSHFRNGSVGSTDSTNTAFHTSDRDIAYEKKSFMSGSSMTHGSLKQLFSHSAMKAPPGRAAADDHIGPKDSPRRSINH